jgi:hypothetical protein
MDIRALRARDGHEAEIDLQHRALPGHRCDLPVAALYGGIPLATLRGAGLAAGLASGGDPDADAALDSVFACPAFMLDEF